MPELPDITVYIEALASRITASHSANENRQAISSPLRGSPNERGEGKRVIGLRRMGKRIVVELEDDLFLVIHLMIAGRLRWLPAGGKVPGKIGLAAFDFPNGSLILTEAGSKRRASLWLVRGEESLEQFERGGLEVLDSDLAHFTKRLIQENHTLKRALADPRLCSGIGNAYSDEILHRRQWSPIKHTRRSRRRDIETLRRHRTVLVEWTERLRAESAGEFPAKVTAFRDEMPCTESLASRVPYAALRCSGSATRTTRRIIAPRCQTEGKLLADRALSRLLKQDCPLDRRAHLELGGRIATIRLNPRPANDCPPSQTTTAPL